MLNLSPTINNLDLKTKFNIENFDDLKLVAELFEFADKIVLESTINYLFRSEDEDHRRIFKQAFRNGIRFTDSLQNRKLIQEIYNSDDFYGLPFSKTSINSLTVNSPIRFDLGVTLATASIVLTLLGTDYDRVDLNIDRTIEYIEQNTNELQIDALNASRDFLIEVEETLTSKRRQVAELRGKIEQRLNDIE